MSAETLRRAAEKLREAAKVTTGAGREWFIADCEMHPRWILADDGDTTPSGYNSDVFRVTEEDVQFEARDADWDWIATMHPGVGLALADWLDYTSALLAKAEELDMVEERPFRYALATASLILGGAS